MKYKLTEIYYKFIYKLYRRLGNPESYYALVTADDRYFEDLLHWSIIKAWRTGVSAGLYLKGRVISDSVYALLYF